MCAYHFSPTGETKEMPYDGGKKKQKMKEENRSEYHERMRIADNQRTISDFATETFLMRYFRAIWQEIYSIGENGKRINQRRRRQPNYYS